MALMGPLTRETPDAHDLSIFRAESKAKIPEMANFLQVLALLRRLRLEFLGFSQIGIHLARWSWKFRKFDSCKTFRMKLREL